MGLEIKRSKNLPIGVDLGSDRLKMAQLRTSEGRYELLGAGAADVPREYLDDPATRFDFLSERIHHILKGDNFKGRKAVLSLPASAVFLQPIKIPIVPAKEVDGTVKGELHDKLPYPVKDAVIRHILAGTLYSDGQEIQERIVVSVPRSELQAHLAMAQRGGLEVVGMNVEACAVVECFARLFRRVSDESRVTLFIDIGAASTQVVLAHGWKMAFARNLPVGGHTLDQTVAEALQTSIEQAHCIHQKLLTADGEGPAEEELFRLFDVKIAEIADDITQCRRYCESFFRNRAIERVIFVGGQAHNKRLCQSIAERLELPAQVGDPMIGIKRLEQPGQAVALPAGTPQPAWAVAIGLSLGAALAA